MGIRDSINNAVRSDRPESPTDALVIYLGFILGMLWIYAQVTGKEITCLVAMLAFIGSIKTIKIGSDFQKKRKAANDVGTAENSTVGNP